MFATTMPVRGQAFKGPRKMKATLVSLLLIVGALTVGCDARVNPIKRLSQETHDRILMTKVTAALRNVPEVASGNIHVKTFTGTVALSGWVSSGNQAWQVIDIVRTVEGVNNVQINLNVKPVTKPRSFAHRVVA